MAYTRIHAIKATVDRSIAYICNPDKTDGELFVSSYGCSARTAALEFAFANGKTTGNDGNLAHHLIQSFAPGEVSFEEAHQIGTELADRLLEGKYSYVLATHIEKDHVHNHIIFCATDNIGHRKYNTCRRNYYRIRTLSDELCTEHHLSVIVPGQRRGKQYEEWEASHSGTSWKDLLRKDIDAVIRLSNTYDDFIRLMKQKGYEIKGESFQESVKYISFRPADRERFVRGSSRSLGAAYTREKIKERIETRDQQRTDYKQRPYSKRRLIDTSAGPFQDSPGLKHWADIENLKIAASAYAGTPSITWLRSAIADKKEQVSLTRSRLVQMEKEMKAAAEILKYAEQYEDNRRYHTNYKKSKNPDAYLRTHESRLLLYDGAKGILDRAGINLSSLDSSQLRADYAAMEKEKAALQNSYKAASKELMTMEQNLQKICQYLQKDLSQDEPVPGISDDPFRSF